MDSTKIDNLLKNKKLFIGCLVIIGFVILLVFLNSQNGEKSKKPEDEVNFEQSYLQNAISIDNFLNGLDTIDEDEVNTKKLTEWFTKLKDEKKQGLETFNSDKYTYVYYGVTCKENESVGFTYGDMVETDDKIILDIDTVFYDDDSKQTENTYENTVFSIKKTDKKIEIKKYE